MVVLDGTVPSARMFRVTEIGKLGEWKRQVCGDGVGQLFIG